MGGLVRAPRPGRLKTKGERRHRYGFRVGEVIMNALTSALLALSLLVCMALFWHPCAKAHSWYPPECCSDHDCAPVNSVAQLVPIGSGWPQLIVTSRFGTAIIPPDFPRRESKDGRMHVCTSIDRAFDIHLICFFMPPTT